MLLFHPPLRRRSQIGETMRNSTKVASILVAMALVTAVSSVQGAPITRNSHMRAIHVGGYWGTNHCFFGKPIVSKYHQTPCSASDPPGSIPPDFIKFLRDTHVNWVGINVSLFYDNVMDSTVEAKYGNELPIPTHTDDELRSWIRAYRQLNFNVFLTLTFDDETFPEDTIALRQQRCGTALYRPERWQLGDPKMPLQDPCVAKEFWPWDTLHPDHTAFVAEFYKSYTDQAVHFAKIAQEEGVGLYALGGETERLFRTRAGGFWIDHYKSELQAMVAAVRQVFSGQLTYDMHYSATVQHRDFFGDGTAMMWDDLGLDVIGIGGYFPLVSVVPTSVPSVGSLQAAYEKIFDDTLVPIQRANSGRPIVFTEAGYIDSLGSVHNATNGDNTPRTFVDADGNGLDDGEETQANAYQAMFNAMRSRPGVVVGAFLWGHMVASDNLWGGMYATVREFSTRGKLSQRVVEDVYGKPDIYNVVEFYNAALDHYFISSNFVEIDNLDVGTRIRGWTRTGQSWNAYPPESTGRSPVCRFYIPPGLGDSHFFGRGVSECAATHAAHPEFAYESPQVFATVLPSAGTCIEGTIPVYRMFSSRPDANHRYTTDRATRDQMIAKGWLAEGDGPDLVAMCAPL